MATPPYLSAAGVTAADYDMPGLLSWSRPPVPDVPVSWRVPTPGLLEAATASTSGVSAGLPMPDVPATSMSILSILGGRQGVEKQAHGKRLEQKPT